MRILYIFITLSLFISQSILNAQDTPGYGDELPDSLIEEEKKALQTMMIWKLTEELDLEVEQADKFFPRFREHRKEVDALKDEERTIGRSLNTNMKSDKKLTGA